MHEQYQKLVEKKDWEYYIYQLKDGYELLVPTPSPAPGVDIIHVLTQEERRRYIEEGKDVLKDRIKDTLNNMHAYKVNAWR